MLVEFTALYTTIVHMDIEVNSASKYCLYVLGTPAEVAAKLNGEAK